MDTAKEVKSGGLKPVAWWVHDLHVARQPVKARGIGPEPTEYLYPASREAAAKEVARLMGGECSPLYEADAFANLAAEAVLKFRPSGPNAKHSVDMLVCDIADAVRIALSAPPAIASPASRAAVTDRMVDSALNAWFSSPPKEDDIGLERSMRAALEAAAVIPSANSVLTLTSEALSEAIAALKACVERMSDDHPGSNEYWQAVERAEALIAKAEGR